MTTTLNEIETDFEMTEEMQSDFDDFKSILNIAKTINQENLFEDCLSDLQRDSLLDIYYNDRPQVSAMALALLKRDNPEFQYSEIIYNIGEEAPMANPYNSGNIRQENSFEYAEFMLYPNPTIDYTTLRYNANYNNLSYIITDIKGGLIVQKKLETIENSEYHEVLIDLRQLAPGTYYLRVKTNNSDLFNSKLVITK